jgi:hypothetical protein
MFSIYDSKLNEALLTKSDWTGPKPHHHEMFTFRAPLAVAATNEKKRANAAQMDAGANKRVNTTQIEPVPSMAHYEEIGSSSKKVSLADTSSLFLPIQMMLPTEPGIIWPLQEQQSIPITEEAENSRTRSLSVTSDYFSPVKIPKKLAMNPINRKVVMSRKVLYPKAAVVERPSPKESTSIQRIESTPASIIQVAVDQLSMDQSVIHISALGAALINTTQNNSNYHDDNANNAAPLTEEVEATASDFTALQVPSVDAPAADAVVVAVPLSMADWESDSDASYAIPLRGFEPNGGNQLPTSATSSSSQQSSSSAAELFLKASAEAVMIGALVDFNRSAEAGTCLVRYVKHACR